MKKMITLMLAVAMLLTMSSMVFAAQSSENTITVNNAKAGETYKAFKMLELNVDDVTNPTAYAYTVAEGWADFFADSNSDVWGTVLEKDATGIYFTAKEGVTSEAEWSATSDLSKFAEEAAKYAAEHNLSPVDTDTPDEGETTAVLNTTESGYYLVTSTLGTRAMIDTTPGDVTINEKNSEDTIVKEVKEDSTGIYGESNDVQVGDQVEFKSTLKVVPRSINVKVHDTMSDGLTFDGNSSIHLYTDADCTTELDSAYYTIQTTPDTGDTFTIQIDDSFAAEATADQYIYITYTATVNNAAVIVDGNGDPVINPATNTTGVSFGDGTNSETDSTTTTTHKFEVKKYANGVENLADAIFQLKKDGDVVNLIKIDDTNYRVADATENTGTAQTHVGENNTVVDVADGSLVSDFVTVSSGNIVIWGVDSDNDYTIDEIQAPKGYNLLNPTYKTVAVSSENNTVVEVENQSGNELPSTGGMGTTIFYVLGGLMVIGAAVILVSKKRVLQ